MSDVEEYEPDRVEGVPHPRMTTVLYGQESAERTVLDAVTRDRVHHAWLLTGPRGVGKATLAWRIARFLIASPQPGGMFGGADTLHVPKDHPVTNRVAALSEPSLFLLRPTLSNTGAERRDITVDGARALRDFLHLSAADGGRRVVLVDAADQLNTQAANAILKLVEEPPSRTVFLLVCHAPARLLPTIRSRCRTLRCEPLSGPDLAKAIAAAGLDPEIEPAALSQLASGSVGEAARLLQEGGPAVYAELVALAATLPDMDRTRLLKLANSVSSMRNRARADMVFRLVDLLLARLARAGAGHPPEAEAARGEAEMLGRLAPSPAAGRAWATLAQEVSGRIAHGRAVNLDPSGLVLDTALRINETGRTLLNGRIQ